MEKQGRLRYPKGTPCRPQQNIFLFKTGDMIEAILAFVFLIGLGFILGYITKQDDAYERGYFFGRADGRTEVFNLFKEENNNRDND